jgi:ferredoxin
MAKITVKNDNVSFEVPDGELLYPYLEENSSLPFGCKKGRCGTCACVILSGEENLEPKSRDEEMLLAKLGNPSSKRNRLACQLRIKKGEVVIEY